MIKKLFAVVLLVLAGFQVTAANSPAKREFRGAWISTVFNSIYKDMSPEQWRNFMIQELDTLKSLGFNAVLFQVRPESDAFYISQIEPWSRWLTGTQGQAPDPLFDPMEFMIEACHERAMEFHAWINPFRVNANSNNKLVENHRYYSKRYLYLSYGKSQYLNPGIAENHTYVCNIIADIVNRYDIDAIHFDDYFYPYPIKGMNFPDNESFKKYGMPNGYEVSDKDKWRRDNINAFVKAVHDTIKAIKPWVRFGISPFGIYRNKGEWPEGGSATNGLSSYNDLYADVLYWIHEGWLDYVIPQIYWEIGHEAADYSTLVHWWAKQDLGKTHLYIGQDVNRSLNQIRLKWAEADKEPNISGHCYWSADMILANKGNFQNKLRIHHKHPAIIPTHTEIDSIKPYMAYNLQFDMMGEAPTLTWDTSDEPQVLDKAFAFVVYGFLPEEEPDLSRADRILGVTSEKRMVLPKGIDALCLYYVVTVTDRLHNESKPSPMGHFDEDYDYDPASY
ncbi:MAG: family 10 glycosylhydrolase [Paludibacteraceae bacterium]|nr:family 10 glycosylhydrolase [Paludibacteraceae bacterium]